MGNLKTIRLLAVLVVFQHGALAELKVGAVLGMTGPASSWGRYAEMGASLAIKEQNEKGGIDGEPVRFLVEDSQSSASGAVRAFQALMASQKPDVMFGDVWAYITEPLIPLAKRHKVTLVSPTVPIENCLSEKSFFFSLGPSPRNSRLATAEFFERNKSVRRVSLFTSQTSWGRAFREVWREEANKRSILIVDDYEYPYTGNREFETLIRRTASKGADAILADSYVEDVIRALNAYKLNIPILAADNVLQALEEGTLPPFEGALFVIDWPMPQDFVRAFETEHKVKPILEAQYSYDALKAIFRGYNPETKRVHMAELKNFGLNGTIDFTSQCGGNNDQAILRDISRGNTALAHEER